MLAACASLLGVDRAARLRRMQDLLEPLAQEVRSAATIIDDATGNVTGQAPRVVTQIRAGGGEYVTPCSVLGITVSNARLFEIQIVQRNPNWRSAMETKLVEHPRRELTDLELEDVSAGRDYYLGFGIHLFVMGNYFLVYTDAKGPVIST